jgi:hypothetical protein
MDFSLVSRRIERGRLSAGNSELTATPAMSQGMIERPRLKSELSFWAESEWILEPRW